VMFRRFHFLKVTWEVKYDHSSLSSYFYPSWHAYLGGCGSKVLLSGIEHGSTLVLMGDVCWSCIHVSCMCVSYTCISCACCICVMINYGCSNVAMENLILIS